MLASTLACTTAADALVNYSGYVPQRLSVDSPSPRWEFLLTCPIESHLSIRIHIWFYQGNVRANHACKLPIAPMGIPADLPNRLSSFNLDRYLILSGKCTCLSRLQTSHGHRPNGKTADTLARLTLAQLRTLRSTTECTCRRDLEKFPSPRWENALLTCPIRFSSFMMGAASIYQPGVRAICA